MKITIDNYWKHLEKDNWEFVLFFIYYDCNNYSSHNFHSKFIRIVFCNIEINITIL